MRVTVTSKGTDLTALINQQLREITNANRKAGRRAAKDGVKAFKGVTPSHFAGYSLKFKAKKVTANPTGGAHVHFQASPVGFWCMLESGARPHRIEPRGGKALRAGSETFWAHVDHPGFGGTGAYSRGEAAAIKAMDKVIEETYSEALDGR